MTDKSREVRETEAEQQKAGRGWFSSAGDRRYGLAACEDGHQWATWASYDGNRWWLLREHCPTCGKRYQTQKVVEE